MWGTLLALGVGALAMLYAGARAVGAAQWRRSTDELRARLGAARAAASPQRVEGRALDGLPAPVQQYFRTVLTDGQPLVTQVRMRQEGTFNASEAGEQWRPFTAEQWVATRRPGFVWNARIAMLPGLPVRVHDAYVAGEGVLHAALLGLVSVADQRGGGALAEGELMRYLAEAAWYPTALLPSQGVAWEAAGDRAADATLTDGDTTVRMRFTFNDQGLIDTVRAEERGRMVGDQTEPTAWRGRFWNYETHGGMQVPTRGEVAWLPPEGEQPYWRGHVTELDYTFAE
jgi:hypothetical protein